MSEIEGRPGLDDLVLREKPDQHSVNDSIWVSDLRDEVRPMYTDDDGKDYDIRDMRDALIAIKANTAPEAVSLSLPNRVRAIYQICCQALPK